MIRRDWAAYFGGLEDAHFGITLTGAWSLAELKDLLAAKDVELANLAHEADAFAHLWATFDPDSARAWSDDYEAMKARYATARARATGALSAFHVLPDNQTGADDEYRGVLTALQRVSGTTSPGDLQDLYNRLHDAAHASGQADIFPKPAPVPQPRAGTDAQENVLKAADSTLRAANAINPLAVSSTTKLEIVAAVLGIAVSLLALSRIAR